MPKDETGLAWSGAPKVERTGGFVGSVSMNADTNKLAVDPEGVARHVPSKRAMPAGGAAVDLQRMEVQPDSRERPKGRFKMPNS
jgi:hypothetical protein